MRLKMKKKEILYAISIEDVRNVSEEIEIDFTNEDIRFIEDKIGDFMGSTWYDAIEFALNELYNHKLTDNNDTGI